MKKWQCTICGYIHNGDEPPETCPVCGADKSLFIEIIEPKDETKKEAASAKTDQTPQAKTETKPEGQPAPPEAPAPPLFSLATATNLMIKFHLHPITVHFPNGVIPVAVAFIFLAVIFQFAGLSKASFYNMIFVILTLPVVLFTGYNEWRKKYKGALTSIFIIKIVSALTVTVSAVIIVIWHMLSPEILQMSSAMRSGFLLLHLIMLAATGIAGHLGGKLIFKD